MTAEELQNRYGKLSNEAQAEVDRLMEKLTPTLNGESGKTPSLLFGVLKGKISMAVDFDAAFGYGKE